MVDEEILRKAILTLFQKTTKLSELENENLHILVGYFKHHIQQATNDDNRKRFERLKNYIEEEIKHRSDEWRRKKIEEDKAEPKSPEKKYYNLILKKLINHPERALKIIVWDSHTHVWDEIFTEAEIEDEIGQYLHRYPDADYNEARRMTIKSLIDSYKIKGMQVLSKEQYEEKIRLDKEEEEKIKELIEQIIEKEPESVGIKSRYDRDKFKNKIGCIHHLVLHRRYNKMSWEDLYNHLKELGRERIKRKYVKSHKKKIIDGKRICAYLECNVDISDTPKQTKYCKEHKKIVKKHQDKLRRKNREISTTDGYIIRPDGTLDDRSAVHDAKTMRLNTLIRQGLTQNECIRLFRMRQRDTYWLSERKKELNPKSEEYHKIDKEITSLRTQMVMLDRAKKKRQREDREESLLVYHK
jgi:hypothetical protein